MKRRNDDPNLDLSTWAEFDAQSLPLAQRETFAARRRAVELYVQGVHIAEIEQLSGVNRRQLYRLVERCVELHSDGRIFGYRALAPYARVADYQRKARIQLHPIGGSRGMAGAFGALLQRHPQLVAWIDEQIRTKRIFVDQLNSDQAHRTRMSGLKHLHAGFLNECRMLGLTAVDYPFSTEQMGIRSFASFVHARCVHFFTKAACKPESQPSNTAVRGAADGIAPLATHVMEVVELVCHRLDLPLKMTDRDALGIDRVVECDRIWLLVVVDAWSQAVLGYHLSTRRDYTCQDVIRTIESALVPHRPVEINLPELARQDDDRGFPSEKFPELAYATWRWFKLDSAKANLAQDVRHALADFIGCAIDVAASSAPVAQAYIDQVWQGLAGAFSSRLPGALRDLRDFRKALTDVGCDLRLSLTHNELLQVLECALGRYNTQALLELKGRTPMETVEYSINQRHGALDYLPDDKKRTLCLMQTPHVVTVRGYLDQGQRPHINFHGVRYSNASLASSDHYLGHELFLYFDSQDLRTVRAFTREGVEVGVLKAHGAWGDIPHDITLRQEVIRLRARKSLTCTLTHEALAQYIEDRRKMAPMIDNEEAGPGG